MNTHVHLINISFHAVRRMKLSPFLFYFCSWQLRMVYIIVPAALQKEIEDTLTELPAATIGVCLWFIEAPPPRRAGLTVYDFFHFSLPHEDIKTLIGLFRCGTRPDKAVAQFVKITDAVKVKRYEQSLVFNMVVANASMPLVAYYPKEERDFHEQQWCTYEITSKNIIFARPIEFVIGVGSLVPAIHKFIRTHNVLSSNIKVTWLPLTLARATLYNPIPLVTRYAECMDACSAKFRHNVLTRLMNILVKVYRSNKRYPFFLDGIPTKPSKDVKYMTHNREWYRLLEHVFGYEYFIFYDNIVCRYVSSNVKRGLRISIRTCAFTEKTYTPTELVAALAQLDTNSGVKDHYETHINHVYGLFKGSKEGARQAYTDYLLWRERYLARQSYKTKLAYIAREVAGSDAEAALGALKGLTVNDLLAVRDMSSRTQLLDEVERTGGYVRASGTFDPLIVDFPGPGCRPPRPRKIVEAKVSVPSLPSRVTVSNVKSNIRRSPGVTFNLGWISRDEPIIQYDLSKSGSVTAPPLPTVGGKGAPLTNTQPTVGAQADQDAVQAETRIRTVLAMKAYNRRKTRAVAQLDEITTPQLTLPDEDEDQNTPMFARPMDSVKKTGYMRIPYNIPAPKGQTTRAIFRDFGT